MFKNFRLEVRHDDTGLWFVTSPDIKGLLVAKRSRSEAILHAAEAIELHASLHKALSDRR